MLKHPELDEALSSIGQRDHSVRLEYRIFGRPGTGKTTNLARQIHRTVQPFGPESVLVTSFFHGRPRPDRRATPTDQF
ncbi:MAG TPA: hypothetical protein VEQ63_09390 [Bryobacteraceae bacterium]|nr:hypothetical protein [Bryobacteraceae bacterium]